MKLSPLFEHSPVIKLTDFDFLITEKNGRYNVKLINPQFRNKDGYIMIYASWCPHCRAKEDFWSYLAEEFNVNKNQKINFRIGVIDADNQIANGKVLKALEIGPIPKFMHVIPNKNANGQEDLVDYQGYMTIESLIGEVCDMSPSDTLCNFNLKSLKPPPIS
jgi:thiol-disulfide isomerase/thioredoxin